jgi:hypothetical protein
MTDQTEFSNGRRNGRGTFPAHWGWPEGSPSSEERVLWVTRNIAEDQALERRGLNAAEVRSGKRATARTMSGADALAAVKAAARFR